MSVAAEAQGFRPARRDWLEALGVGVALFALYAATAPRTVATEDDGLFVLSSYFLGVEHPPGYPLYTLLGKLFTLLPVGSVAYRVHLLSGLLGGASCAALWLCARQLIDGRLPAYVAALGLGLSVTFWSQALIAEVYTFNTLFFIVLLWMALRASARTLPWMALLFGLSLANHYPLMLLVAPAFAILLWPLRGEMLRRLPLLAVVLLLAAALPYAWLVYRSWDAALPASFYGPLETPLEIWFFLGRIGYGGIDQSASSGLPDRLGFIGFVGQQLLLQFAVIGTALAALGCWAQRRVWGDRVSAFFVIGFLMPTVVLALLLGFDYDALTKHVFHVYPLPAYAVVALWMGLGFAWLAERLRLARAPALAAGAGVLVLIGGVGAQANVGDNQGWAARYGHAVLAALPPNASLFVEGDAAVAPIAYLHLVEKVRPDVTLLHSQGLIFGNRLFHFLRASDDEARAKLAGFVEQAPGPVAFNAHGLPGYARRERWLYWVADKGAAAGATTIEVPEASVQFLEQAVLGDAGRASAWVAHHRNELRHHYALLLAQQLSETRPPDERVRRQLAALQADYYGALGLAEGLLASPHGFPVPVVHDLLARAQALMPQDVRKMDRAKYFYVRAALSARGNDTRGAIRNLEAAVAAWPVPQNRAVQALADVRRAAAPKGTR